MTVTIDHALFARASRTFFTPTRAAIDVVDERNCIILWSHGVPWIVVVTNNEAGERPCFGTLFERTFV